MRALFIVPKLTHGPCSTPWTTHQLLRYARHILLDGLGIEGQQASCWTHTRWSSARAAWAAPAVLYLGTASGVGRITVVDHDTVELSNLQRQIGHGTLARLGQPKADSAAPQHRGGMNPGGRRSSRGSRSVPMPRCWIALVAAS